MYSRIVTWGGDSEVKIRDNVAQRIDKLLAPGDHNPGYTEIGNQLIPAAKVGDETELRAWLTKRDKAAPQTEP